MRAQDVAEVAIEQGETQFEGVSGLTPDQIAANQEVAASPVEPGWADGLRISRLRSALLHLD